MVVVVLESHVCAHVGLQGIVVEVVAAAGDALPLLRAEVPPAQEVQEEAQRAQLEEHSCTHIHTYH